MWSLRACRAAGAPLGLVGLRPGLACLSDEDGLVAFDDRLYRVGDRIAVNRATMSKWGVKLGELSLFFQRVPDNAARNDKAPA